MLVTSSRRFGLAFMSMLFLTMLFPLNFLPDTALAQNRPIQCPQKKLCSLAAAAHPTSAGSSVTLNPSEAPAGSTITGVGSNWASGDYILVQWYDWTTLGNTTVQSDGTFTISFTVPSNAAQGSYDVYFTDQTAGYFIPATLTVGTCSSSSLTVQSVYTTDSNFNSTSVFAQGSAINYIVDVNNSCSGSINARFHFQDFWGTINDLPLEIFDGIYQNVTLPAGVSGWYVSATVPTNALPGSFTDEVNIGDMNSSQDNSTGTNSFRVTGSLQVTRSGKPVPYYSQFQGQPTRGKDCGPTSVLMVLTYYGKGPGLSANGITQVRKHTNHPTGGNTLNTDLEKALSYYDSSSSWTEIPRSIPNLPNPQAQLTEMAAAIVQGQPVIAFLNGSDLPGHPTNYGGHWLVLRGFSSNQTSDYVLVNDPDSDYSGGYPGHPSKIKLSAFQTAEVNGESDQPYGIIVTS